MGMINMKIRIVLPLGNGIKEENTGDFNYKITYFLS